MSVPTPAPSPATGLDVAAIIFSVLLAPVGLILGLVSRSAAKSKNVAPHVLATASIVVGGILTGLGLLGLAATGIVVAVIGASVSGAASSAEAQASCASLTPYSDTLSAYSAIEEPRGDDASADEWTSLAAASAEVAAIANAIQDSGPYANSLVDDAKYLETSSYDVSGPVENFQGIGGLARARIALSSTQSAAQTVVTDIDDLCSAN